MGPANTESKTLELTGAGGPARASFFSGIVFPGRRRWNYGPTLGIVIVVRSSTSATALIAGEARSGIADARAARPSPREPGTCNPRSHGELRPRALQKRGAAV